MALMYHKPISARQDSEATVNQDEVQFTPELTSLLQSVLSQHVQIRALEANVSKERDMLSLASSRLSTELVFVSRVLGSICHQLKEYSALKSEYTSHFDRLCLIYPNALSSYQCHLFFDVSKMQSTIESFESTLASFSRHDCFEFVHALDPPNIKVFGRVERLVYFSNQNEERLQGLLRHFTFLSNQRGLMKDRMETIASMVKTMESFEPDLEYAISRLSSSMKEMLSTRHVHLKISPLTPLKPLNTAKPSKAHVPLLQYPSVLLLILLWICKSLI